MGTGPQPAQARSASANDRFGIRGTIFLDKAMPVPVALTCGYACAVSPYTWPAVAVAVVFIAGNIALNTTIQRRVANDEDVGYLLGPARGAWAVTLIPVLVALAGPAGEGWLPALPALLAMPFLLRPMPTTVASALLIALVTAARLVVGVELLEAFIETLGMASASLVAVPVAHAMRRHVDTLIGLQDELQLQIDRAQASSRAKSSFLAQMSHEIRTPLNGIIGSLELLGRGDDSLDGATEEEESLLDAARSSADGLLDLIDDILDLSKVEAGHMQADCRPTHAEALLDQVRNAFRAVAVERGISLELSCDVSAAWGSSDPVRLRQIVFNLVSNAIKFTASGRVSVRLTTTGERLRLAVEDTGRGMEPAVLARVFEPFEQAEAGQPGTGLGLSLVVRLTDLLDGTLEADSTPGEGSRFVVEVPWPPCDAPTRATAGLPVIEVDGLRVLLVEDNPVNQKIIVTMLGRLGCETALVETGAAAVSRAAEGFDLILMDVHLPDYDGFEATTRIRAAGVQTPIWALTAGALIEDRQRAREVGMDGFMTKPVRVRDLADVLHHLTDPSHPPAAVPADRPTPPAPGRPPPAPE